MIISCHQPQYLPWIGYFDKIDSSDTFVFLEDVQYKKREFQNRNKIRTKDGWVWLTVPVITKQRFTQKISEVRCDNTSNWQKDHWESMRRSYAHAPHFNEHADFFKEVYSKRWERLLDLNVHIIKYILNYMGIKTTIYYDSALQIETSGTERIIQICKRLGADTYLSGVGGKAYLDEARFTQEGIEMAYQDFRHPQYQQQYNPFIPNMSIVDLLFNCGPGSLEIVRSNEDVTYGGRV